ncbi:hypothetical protein THAR02_11312 [Trichoderma harzianum]|uniref:Uncharacterized protein n=1 Tax=Trichoderma harzianum TaxID=5544 RepID=A0A0F9WVT7_TRIHA|nr:hypothetical protein THAR02_11312 [Trichoderma harzianum]
MIRLRRQQLSCRKMWHSPPFIASVWLSSAFPHRLSGLHCLSCRGGGGCACHQVGQIERHLRGGLV